MNHDRSGSLGPPLPAWLWIASAVSLASVIVSNGLWFQSPYTALGGGGWRDGVLWTNIALLAITSAFVGKTWSGSVRGAGTGRAWIVGAAITATASLALLTLL